MHFKDTNLPVNHRNSKGWFIYIYIYTILSCYKLRIIQILTNESNDYIPMSKKHFEARWIFVLKLHPFIFF